MLHLNSFSSPDRKSPQESSPVLEEWWRWRDRCPGSLSGQMQAENRQLDSRLGQAGIFLRGFPSGHRMAPHSLPSQIRRSALAGVGYAAAEIAALREKGVV